MVSFDNQMVELGPFVTVTIGIIVLFLGKRLNAMIRFFSAMNIPEPVTGGLLLSLFIGGIHFLTGVGVHFDLRARDILLVYFFTTIGINASFRDLLSGGKPLLILLTITIVYMVLQNVIGISVARIFGLPSAIGVLGGTVSLIGGHGTAIAWAPQIAEQYGVAKAMEIGIACATFGLILASLMGGPIARYLIRRHNIPPAVQAAPDVGLDVLHPTPPISHLDILDAVLAIHICIIAGLLLNDALADLGLQLPLFVTCLFAGILITNLLPRNFPRLTGRNWPARTPPMALLADIALGTFLAMSLMSMQLWLLIELAGPILSILVAQFVVAVLVTLFVIFPAMGKGYDATVVCAGFGGISLGSTPTAMANMAAVTQHYGPSHLAFVVVPLVSAFFIDLINALAIPFFLRTF